LSSLSSKRDHQDGAIHRDLSLSIRLWCFIYICSNWWFLWEKK